jgi:hypothetical protein
MTRRKTQKRPVPVSVEEVGLPVRKLGVMRVRQFPDRDLVPKFGGPTDRDIPTRFGNSANTTRRPKGRRKPAKKGTK